jgi:hypothetical protein
MASGNVEEVRRKHGDIILSKRPVVFGSLLVLRFGAVQHVQRSALIVASFLFRACVLAHVLV